MEADSEGSETIRVLARRLDGCSQVFGASQVIPSSGCKRVLEWQAIPEIDRELERNRKSRRRREIARDIAQSGFTQRMRLLAVAVWAMTGPNKSAEEVLHRVYGRCLPAGNTCIEEWVLATSDETISSASVHPVSSRGMCLGRRMEDDAVASPTDQTRISAVRTGSCVPVSVSIAEQLPMQISVGQDTKVRKRKGTTQSPLQKVVRALQVEMAYETRPALGQGPIDGRGNDSPGCKSADTNRTVCSCTPKDSTDSFNSH